MRNPEKEMMFYVDGPNIDATLGNCILGRKPNAWERPRWDRVKTAVRQFAGPVKPVFVLNGDRFSVQMSSFYRALKTIGFNPIAPRSEQWQRPDCTDPVDCYIRSGIEECSRSVVLGDSHGVALASHDHGYAPYLEEILRAGGTVILVGFHEWFPKPLSELEALGAQLLDLEFDLGAFDYMLPDRPRRAA